MKITAEELQVLKDNLKAFKAGIIDKKLDEHIDNCFEDLLIDLESRKPWWKFW